MTWSERSARTTLEALVDANQAEQVLKLATGFGAENVGAGDATTVTELSEDLGEQWVVETVFEIAGVSEVDGGTPRDWLGGQPDAEMDADVAVDELVEVDHRGGGGTSTPQIGGGLEPGQDFPTSVGPWDLVGMSAERLPTFYGPEPEDGRVWTVVLKPLHEQVVAYVADLDINQATEEWVTEFAKTRVPAETVRTAVQWMEDHQTNAAVRSFVDDNWGGARV